MPCASRFNPKSRNIDTYQRDAPRRHRRFRRWFGPFSGRRLQRLPRWEFRPWRAVDKSLQELDCRSRRHDEILGKGIIPFEWAEEIHFPIRAVRRVACQQLHSGSFFFNMRNDRAFILEINDHRRVTLPANLEYSHVVIALIIPQARPVDNLSDITFRRISE